MCIPSAIRQWIDRHCTGVAQPFCWSISSFIAVLIGFMAGDVLHTKSCSVACLIAIAMLILEAVNTQQLI